MKALLEVELAKPIYDSDDVDAFAHTLYGKSPADRARTGRTSQQRVAARDGLAQVLFHDLTRRRRSTICP